MTESASEPSCLVCRSVSGERRISPGPPVYRGRYWALEHAYPTSLPGWLVIVLNRHAEALHELSQEEFAELSFLQHEGSRLLQAAFGCSREYLMCIAEKPGFRHLHFHLVPKPDGLPEQNLLQHLFAYINPPEGQALPAERVIELCRDLQARFLVQV